MQAARVREWRPPPLLTSPSPSGAACSPRLQTVKEAKTGTSHLCLYRMTADCRGRATRASILKSAIGSDNVEVEAPDYVASLLLRKWSDPLEGPGREGELGVSKLGIGMGENPRNTYGCRDKNKRGKTIDLRCPPSLSPNIFLFHFLLWTSHDSSEI